MKEIRVSLGLGQQEVANRLEMPIRRYGSYERGERTLSLADAARIADVFDCSLDELAGRDFRREQTELSADERDLIGLYRDAGTEGQHIVMRTAEGAAEAFDRGGTPETLLPPPRLRKAG